MSAKEEYKTLLRKLSSILEEDRGDSEEADEIRDLMDGPWEELTKEERAEVNVLAVELEKQREGNRS